MSYFYVSGDSQTQELDNAFSAWIDSVQGGIPAGAKALNFNLYEGSQGAYGVQLIASTNFDENDYDWACDPEYSSGENVFLVPREKSIEKWQDGLTFISGMIKRYLSAGDHAAKLKSYGAVCVGFVDGDIDVLHKKPSLFLLEQAELQEEG